LSEPILAPENPHLLSAGDSTGVWIDNEPVQQGSEKADSTEYTGDGQIAEGAEKHNDRKSPSCSPTASRSNARCENLTFIQISGVPISTEDQPQDHTDKILSPPGQNSEENDTELPVPFIYLVKPRTMGSRRVLIPLDVGQTVRDILTNNEVDEFPTFQTLISPPTSLLDGYILLADYLKILEKNYDQMNPLVSSNLGLTAAHHESRPIPSCNDILATLKRDIAGKLS
jgi:hypothetical protein